MEGQFKLLEYVRSSLLCCSATCGWTTSWYSGLAGAFPGHTALTEQQSLERFNQSIKDSLPAGFERMGLPTATPCLERAVRAFHIRRGFVDAEEHDQSQVGSDLVSRGLMWKDWLQTYDQDCQYKLPSVKRYVPYPAAASLRRLIHI